MGRRNYSEADRIITIFTKSYGKLALIAKGVRKPSSRKRGHLEIFSYLKFSARENGNIDYLSEAEVIDPFEEIRKDLKKISVAYFLCEVVNRTTREDEPHERLFELLTRALKDLKNSHQTRLLRQQFIRDTLVILGFWPEGKTLTNPDNLLEEIVEREMFTKRVGRKVLS